MRGYVQAVSGHLGPAQSDLESSLAIARDLGDANRQGLVLHLLATVRNWQARSGEALELGGRGVALARRHHLVIPLIRGLWSFGMAACGRGDYDTAMESFREGRALSERIGDDAYVPRFLNTLGWLHIDCGDFAHGIELSEHAFEITAR